MSDSHRPRRDGRLVVYRILLVATFLVMVGQLWRLQMVRGGYYQRAADVNRFRLERNPAPRGVIYDRRGHLLVRNQPQITVSVVPAYLPEDESDRHALLVKLAKLLHMPMVGYAAQDPFRYVGNLVVAIAGRAAGGVLVLLASLAPGAPVLFLGFGLLQLSLAILQAWLGRDLWRGVTRR